MSSIAQDIKSGLKGIKGAGDAIRGELNKAGDELLDPKGTSHPDTAASHAKNAAIADKGIAEANRADQEIGARHGVATKHTAAATTTAGEVGTAGTTVPGATGAAGTGTPVASSAAATETYGAGRV